MIKIKEIIKFNKLLFKSLNIIYNELCDILQNATFYSQSTDVPHEIYSVYVSNLHLLYSTIENYLNIFDHLDISWYPGERTGEIYFNYYKPKL